MGCYLLGVVCETFAVEILKHKQKPQRSHSQDAKFREGMYLIDQPGSYLPDSDVLCFLLYS